MKQLPGVRIAVTRMAAQSRELAEPLEQAGAQVFVCPLIKIEAVVERAAADRALQTLPEFSWIIFTSANGVEQFMRLLADAGRGPAALLGKRIACVGPATARAAERFGLRADAIPDDFVGEAVTAALLKAGSLRGQKVLIARAAGGGRALPQQLAAAGAMVEDLELYRSVPDLEGAAQLRRLVQDGRIELVTFTSGSAVTYFVETIDIPRHMLVAVIGPSTAEVARSHGLRVDIEANPHTTAGLVTAILDYFAADRGNWRSDAGK